MFIHTVFFHTKPGTPESAVRQLLTDCREILGKIESVKQLHAGPPALNDPPREVVDATYTVGLTVIFDDQAGHDFYQPHPLHTQFIERNKGAWERVRVYDFVA